ncbi:hypothetical protein DFH09DRAFT_1301615 [Mycena vulgaris]|nr:hypothetical protein DFH09DRAFT_1301615 [Mycena vulgaris]
MLGFLVWLQTVKAVAEWAIGDEDKEFVKTLRPKAGVMYNLSRDYHEANFIHLLNHDVPIHYPWTDKERADMRFLQLSPEYWNETCETSQGPFSIPGGLEDLDSAPVKHGYEEQRVNVTSQEAPMHHLPPAPPVIQAFEPKFDSREEAVAVIDEWADSVIERFPHIAAYPNLEWNLQWLGKGILVSSDPRALTYMKAYTARDDGVRYIEEVLELAIRYGLPFSIGIRWATFVASKRAALAPYQ